MRVQVGLVGDSPGWRSLLHQEGVSFSVLSVPDQFRNDQFSVLVVYSRLSVEWCDVVKKFVRQGGALIVVAEHFTHMFGKRGNRRSIRYLIPQPSSLFHGVGIADIFRSGVVVNEAQWFLTDSKVPSILVEQFEDGMIVVIPVDFGSLVTDLRIRRKAFYMKGTRLPAERVSLVSKGEVRKIVHHLLRIVHTERGIPYCHLWYFPDAIPNVFAVRIDTDFGTEKEVDVLYQLAEEKNIRMSWFLHVEAHRQWLKKFLEMHGHDIGVHCYEHRMAGREDMEKALQELLTVGFKPVGFAATYGAWSPEVGRAAEELGFLYSSEFSFDYDNLPSFPMMAGDQSAVLQVPVHPICIGSFRRCKVGEREIVEYFNRTVDWKIAAHEPLFFYHHPKDGYPNALRHLMDWASANTVRNLLLSEFASWWKKRAGWRADVEIRERSLRVGGNWDSSAALRIIRGDAEAIVVLDREINMNALPWIPVGNGPELPSDIERIRRFSPRLVFETAQNSWRRKFR
jgi:peptidoglycan/xylan/chitin deacetylase (PgdA/CDA1 family)